MAIVFPSVAKGPELASRYFNKRELACKCGGRFCAGEWAYDPDFIAMLDNARVLSGVPYDINSGRRCARHNARVGGVSNSQHTVRDGIAVDIPLAGHDRVKLVADLVRSGIKSIGFGATFVHVDGRKDRARAWQYGSKGFAAWTKAYGFNPVDAVARRGIRALLVK